MAVRLVFLITLLVATAIDISAWWALGHMELPATARIVVALLPLPGNIVLIAMVLRGIRKLDEFQKRIHFEAVTLAFLSTGVAVFVFGFLQKAHAVGPLNMGLVWAFMVIFYAIGYFIAVSHYK
ncbi:MAG: hypothetical protein ABSE86_11480 [Bryobacteraceae bacterium]